jgi:hypothetical protein
MKELVLVGSPADLKGLMARKVGSSVGGRSAVAVAGTVAESDPCCTCNTERQTCLATICIG